jgi:DNA-binding MurR/RpiR family transcriptional regulator
MKFSFQFLNALLRCGLSRAQEMVEAMSDAGIPPESVAEVLDRIDQLHDTMPKRLRQCAAFLRANVDQIAVSTVADAAAAAGVAPSAFMRFCQKLGFSGYSDMQALFRSEYAQIRPNYAERLAELRAKGGQDSSRMLADLVEASHKSLVSLSTEVMSARVEEAVRMLEGAQVVHLYGMRRAFAVTSYLGYMLQKMEVPSVLHTASGRIDPTDSMREGDVLFAATFAPFSPETVMTAQKARDERLPVILLTDSAQCPVAEFADAVLIAREVDVEGFRTPTAALTLTTTIAVVLGGRRDADSDSRLLSG